MFRIDIRSVQIETGTKPTNRQNIFHRTPAAKKYANRAAAIW